MYTLQMDEAMFSSKQWSLYQTLPIAVLLHALLIFGISFVPELSSNTLRPPTLDVTLVQMHSETEPENAEFVAQANQQASGDGDQKNRPRSPMASLKETPVDGVSPIESTESAPQEVPKLQPQLLTTKGNTLKRINKDPERPLEQERPPAENLADKTQTIARLIAEVDEAEARYARRPRIHFTDAVSARGSIEAPYIDAWVKKIERVGNLNFPKEAIRRSLSGKLILNVTLDHGGNVVDVQIDTSSGYNVLDKAALRIVKLASPYAPLPKEIRKQWDQLNITRTWIFHSGTLNTE